MARKLKVFQAQFGFYDSVVAAASQAAALRAWGAHQNLFGDGGARLATDSAAIEAALAQPDVPLRRAVGSDEPFGLNPGLPRLPDLPKAASKPKAASRAAPKPAPPDRSALDAAEAALGALDASWTREQQDFRSRRETLDAEERDARTRHAEARAHAEATLKRAQQAFVRAGGRAGRSR